MTVVLSLLAALSYGVSDFVGGLASRRASATTVLVHAYPVGAALIALTLPLLPGALSWTTVGAGVAGGVVGLVGVLSLYSAIAAGPMSVVSPVSAVLTAAVPIVVGVLTGDRPAVLAWVGVAVGLVAVLLVGGIGRGTVPARALALAMLAGLGFGLYFVALARAPTDSGVWPLLVSRLVSALLVVPLAVRTGSARLLGGTSVVLAVASGVFDAAANLAFLLASRVGLLSLASVLTALYPAVTVLLAAGLLHERPSRLQQCGLLAALAAVVLITV